MFKKVLIANRGEIALRVIRVCKQFGIKTVAVYSQADRDSLHVRFADEAVCIGPPPGKESYLKIPRIIAAAEITNADAIHPGYGFLAENASFAEICTTSGIKFIGPTPEMISADGGQGAGEGDDEEGGRAGRAGERWRREGAPAKRSRLPESIGFPVIIKAVAGGGGRGMRIVREESEMDTAFKTAQHEAEQAFNNPDVYIEKYIEQAPARRGPGLRRSARQRDPLRRTRLLRPASAPETDRGISVADRGRRTSARKWGRRRSRDARPFDYENAGTIEFLVDKDKNFYFMEMNTRIQVEHPVTEQVTGHDLIKLQLRWPPANASARRRSLPAGMPSNAGSMPRIPPTDFRPSPGTITDFHMPGGFGVRVDTHSYAGYHVPPYYDSLIAKLIVFAQTREGAINKMASALEEFTIEGIKTTIPFHRQVMRDERFRSGNFDTSFLDSFEFKVPGLNANLQQFRKGLT